jgi:carboxypeptidase Q
MFLAPKGRANVLHSMSLKNRTLLVGVATIVTFVAAILSVDGHSSSAKAAQEQSDLDAVQRIRAEALDHSHVMDTIGMLTDVYGPRLTGSPNLADAEQWVVQTLHGWGVENAHLERWGPFGRGWTLEGLTASMTAQIPGSAGRVFVPLIAYPKAWSPGTNGMIRGDVVYLDVSSESDLAMYRGKLRGKIVLFAPVRNLPPNFVPDAPRTSDADLKTVADAKLGDQPPFQPTPQQRAAATLNDKKWEFAYAEDPAVIVEPGFKDAGTVYVTAAALPQNERNRDGKEIGPWDLSKPKVIPQLVVSTEQYNRMVRMIGRGVPVQMEVNIAVRFYDGDPMSANVIAEIPGTDLKDEIVMIGGCIDSWHAGTGATDNAAGVAVAMEVIRIIKSLGLAPRRTIRIGLWSAEEQGRLGSAAYAAEHFGRMVNGKLERKPDYDKFDVYFNLDYGTGRIRGIYLQGNEAVRPIFQAWLAPLSDLGASTLTIRNMGADHLSFDEIGLPGFQFLRDYMEFDTRPAHTNMDVYDHVLPEDLKQSAAVAAALVYDAAMRNQKLPRKNPPTQ